MRALLAAPFPTFHPVIPAKAGIQRRATKSATGNQARIATDNPFSLDGRRLG